jgi:phosphotriesterase-related protein
MHDHVLSDSSRLQRAGAAPGPGSDEVTPEVLGYLRWNTLALADNLRLDDPDLAVTELARAVARGQTALVECSSWGLGPDHAGLPAISAASGMTIVSSYGAYIPRTVPGWIAQMSEGELETHLFEALTVAIPGTSFRAGTLGIMGTTDELAPREREQLRAAARAAVRTGAGVSVRLDPEAFRGLEVLGILAGEGLPADRVVLTNADEYLDRGYWGELADAGAVLEMCFGTEAVHDGRVDNPSDRERLAFFPAFVADHPRARHVLGQSVWTKAQLRAHGGHGYAYLMERIVPVLQERGVPAARIQTMLVEEPRRLLDRPPTASPAASDPR